MTTPTGWAITEHCPYCGWVVVRHGPLPKGTFRTYRDAVEWIAAQRGQVPGVKGATSE